MDVSLEAMKEGDYTSNLKYSQMIAKNWWTNVTSVWRNKRIVLIIMLLVFWLPFIDLIVKGH
jgi:hypothetical protein